MFDWSSHTCEVKDGLEAHSEIADLGGVVLLDALRQHPYALPVLLGEQGIVVGVQCRALKPPNRDYTLFYTRHICNLLTYICSVHIQNIAVNKRKVLTTLVFSLFNLKKVSKGKFLYSAVSSPQSAFTLYFPGRPVQSNTVSTSLGSIQPHATINVRKAARTHTHHCL